MRPETDMTPEQARKEERDAIVEWLRQRARFHKAGGHWGDFAPLIRDYADAIQRGDHREGKDG